MFQKLLVFISLSLCMLTTIQLLASNNAEKLLFVENKGQWPNHITHQLEFNTARVFLEKNKLTYLLLSPEDITAVHEAKHHNQEKQVTIHGHVFQVNFINTNPQPNIESSCKSTTYRNYFVGNDKEKWATNVGLFQQIDYRAIYEGIDMRLYETAGKLKYDFIVSPQTDIQQIRWQYEGVDDVFIANNQLHTVTSVNTLIEEAPYAYQNINGQTIEVPCFFNIDEHNEVSFSFPNGYDTNHELIIDPTLIFASYTGSTADNWGFTATYDEAGHLYAAGTAFNVGYPTTLGAFQETFADGAGVLSTDIGISKFSPDGSTLLYSTYLGGTSANELPHSLIVNSQNELCLFGTTGSGDFPALPNAVNRIFQGGNATSVSNISFPNGSDIIVTKFNETGTELAAATYFGGTSNDGLNLSDLRFNYADEARGEIFLDKEDNIYIASCTQSDDFLTTTGALQTTLQGTQDGCLIKFDGNLTTLLASTYLGGSGQDAAYSIKVDNNNNLYVAGGTNSNDFPTTDNAIQPTYSGGNVDAFLAKIEANATQIINSTYLGTPAYDQSFFVELDSENNVYTFGQTMGAYPTTGGVYTNPNSGQYIHKLSNDLSSTIFSTTVGNSNGLPNIAPTAFLVDKCNQIYLSGWGGTTGGGTLTTEDLPLTTNAFQSTTDGSDFYFMILAPNATGLTYATYFGADGGGGEHVDGGTSRFSKEGIVYQAVCAGCGGSNLFPTTPGAWSEVNNAGNCNLGVIKFAFEVAPITANFDFTQTCIENTAVQFANTSIQGASYIWDFGDGSPTSSDINPTHTYPAIGAYEVSLIAFNSVTCNSTDTIKKVVNITTQGGIDIVTTPFCLNDNTQNFSVGIEVTGEENTIYQLTESQTNLSTTILANEEVNLTFSSAINAYTLIINNDGCLDSILITSPNCPDCEPNAGTMPTDLQIACSEETIGVDTTDAVLETGQVLGYVLHTSTTQTLGNILATNTTGEFAFADITDGTYYTTYYISAIVGPLDTNGFPSLGHDCTVNNIGTPIVFLAPITFEIDEFCDNTTGNYTLTFVISGGFPQFDQTANYTVSGDFNGTLGFQETAQISFPQNTGLNNYEFTVTDDGLSCGGQVAAAEYTCLKNPIELVDFTVEKTANGQLIQWSVATEINNDYFTILRSFDGIHFEEIGKIAGRGNAITLKEYEFLEEQTYCGLVYYQLTWTSFTNITEASTVISIQGSQDKYALINVYPIPTQEFINVQLIGLSGNGVEIAIFDLTGKAQHNQLVNLANCKEQLELPIANYPSGVYLVKVTNGIQTAYTKFLKR